jgi:hypothetical protein
MAQPTAVELFGAGTTISGGNLTVPLSGLTDTGLSGTAPIEVYAAIVKKSSDWLVANTDETVMAASTASVFAPSTRNALSKTQFTFALSFYGAYTSPTLDPDDL